MVRYHLNHKMVDWEDDGTYIFTNPKLGKADQQLIKVNKIPPVKGTVWVGSSGTTAEHSFKLLGLKKSAFLASAEAVCEHLHVTESDVWLNVLPRFHVGGLSIEARSHVSGCLVVQHKEPHFDIKLFCKAIEQFKVTMTSLVPTQVYEIVKNNVIAPKTLRVLLVGGGHLSDYLYQQAISLGWPVVLTYGMTELCSQIATSRLEDIFKPERPKAYLLNHIEAKTDDKDYLYIKSKALFFKKIIFKKETVELSGPESDWYKTNDMVHLEKDDVLKFIGRGSSMYKISGELVNLAQLNRLLSNILHEEGFTSSASLKTSPHLKYGHQVNLVVEGVENLSAGQKLKEKFNSQVAKFEAIKNIYFVKKINTNAMGKVLEDIWG